MLVCTQTLLVFVGPWQGGQKAGRSPVNVTLMSSLQVLQNKAAKIILDRPLYSFTAQTLTTLH